MGYSACSLAALAAKKQGGYFNRLKMSETLKINGGVKIGMANVTRPLGSLTVTKNRLDINGGLFGNLSFLPGDIIALKPYNDNSLLGNNIQIVHNIPNYKRDVYFNTRKDPQTIVNQITTTGFFDTIAIDSTIEKTVRERQKQGALPIKRLWLIITGLVWNIGILTDIIIWGSKGFPKSPPQFKFAIVSIGFTLAFFIGLLASQQVRKVVLKPLSTLEDIQTTAYFIGFILLMLFTGFSATRFM